jgi:two-component system, OmpR family, sensor histidine kinase KdpD
MEEKRPNPEVLLARIKKEEQRETKGKLKLFFGAAPGVGKTHTMLEDALELLVEGVDVVAGIVETHGRKEIERLLSNIEQLPQRKINYHGRILQEFDLDKVLERKPGLILIDELAHTNLPNSKHAKRWQDVKEILEHGINVYSTLNVQHLESLNDVIFQITGVTVRETVPDIILEEADVVELIDLPPDDLLRRLQEGRVYAPEQAELAKQNFFNKGNLIALRELALRITTDRVSAQVLSYRESQAIQKTWPTTERLLVCINPNAESAKLVRAARRMAARLHAEWLAAYVAPAKHGELSDVEQHHLENNFRLAERLGGETVTLTGRNVVDELINFARDRNITKIVIGKEMHSRIKTFFFGSIIDELLRQSGDIDIYVIQGGYEKSHRFLPIITIHPTSAWQEYLFGGIPVLLATLIGFLSPANFGPTNLGMIYMLGVVSIAVRGKRGPAILASILSVLAFDFFFVPPRYSFYIQNFQYVVTFIVMLIVALLITQLTIGSKRSANIARLRERRAAAMYAMSRKLANSRGLDNILQTAVQHIAEVFDSQVAALLPNEENQLIVTANSGSEFLLDDKEKSVAKWVYDMGQVAGFGTETLPFVPAIYIPLLGKNSIIGVLRVLSVDRDRFSRSEQLHLLETFANQTAYVIEAERKG